MHVMCNWECENGMKMRKKICREFSHLLWCEKIIQSTIHGGCYNAHLGSLIFYSLISWAPKWRFELLHIFKMPNTTIKSDFNSRFIIYFWENRKNPRLFDLLYWTFVGPISQSNLFILFRRPIFYYSTKSQVLIHHRSWFWASSFFKSFTIVGSYFMIQTTYPL